MLRSPFFFGLDKVIGSLASDKPLPPESAGPLPDAPDVTPLGVAERGSNGFAVAPRRSADGATRLISNAHQPWTGAAAWYELVVHSGTGWNFAGATFPGVPYPLMGHNRTLGWTNTVNRPDLVDVYRLALDADGRRYRWDGGWRTLERHRVWLPVKLWGPFVLPVPRMVERAVQGPVITGKHGSFAIRYAGANQLGMVEEYYRLTRATDFVGWQRALARQAVPATNFVYADAAGHIGLFYNASFPRRRPGFDYRHILPGDTSRAFTPGTVPWAEVPRNVDPVSGFIVNANDSPFQAAGTGSELDPHAFSPLLGIETDTTNRGRRALELMGAIRAIGDADLLRIKFDTGVSRASWAGRWMRDVLTTPAVTVDGRRPFSGVVSGRWMEHLPSSDTERLSEVLELVDRDRVLLVFKITDVGPVNPGLCGKLFLGYSPHFAQHLEVVRYDFPCAGHLRPLSAFFAMCAVGNTRQKKMFAPRAPSATALYFAGRI